MKFDFVCTAGNVAGPGSAAGSTSRAAIETPCRCDDRPRSFSPIQPAPTKAKTEGLPRRHSRHGRLRHRLAKWIYDRTRGHNRCIFPETVAPPPTDEPRGLPSARGSAQATILAAAGAFYYVWVAANGIRYPAVEPKPVHPFWGMLLAFMLKPLGRTDDRAGPSTVFLLSWRSSRRFAST